MTNKKKSMMIYEPEKGYIRIETRIENETVWLTQDQIAAVFGTQRPAITKHLGHIFETKELNENSVSSKIELTARDGKNYMVKIYNLDAIISVGYRVNSKKATEFRMWATNILKNHIVDGYTRKNDNKNEFLALATHQIRGPLGAIRGYVSLLLEGSYGNVPKEFIEPLDIIFRSTDTLNKTVSDFLDISRIEQGEMKYHLKDFNLVDLVKEVIDEMKLGIKNSNLDLRLKITNIECLVHEDKAKLKQVLINLIDNAHKYTKNGWIEISLHKNKKDLVLFSIKDSGVGISKETMPLLFKKFSRSKDSHGVNILGTGLGLYIAKKILEAGGGRVWAESGGENKGSQFYVELPIIQK
jgi:signal transduction histidine kinase